MRAVDEGWPPWRGRCRAAWRAPGPTPKNAGALTFGRLCMPNSDFHISSPIAVVASTVIGCCTQQRVTPPGLRHCDRILAGLHDKPERAR